MRIRSGEVHFEPISLAWSLCCRHLKPSLPGFSSNHSFITWVTSLLLLWFAGFCNIASLLGFALLLLCWVVSFFFAVDLCIVSFLCCWCCFFLLYCWSCIVSFLNISTFFALFLFSTSLPSSFFIVEVCVFSLGTPVSKTQVPHGKLPAHKTQIFETRVATVKSSPKDLRC